MYNLVVYCEKEDFQRTLNSSIAMNEEYYEESSSVTSHKGELSFFSDYDNKLSNILLQGLLSFVFYSVAKFYTVFTKTFIRKNRNYSF